MAKTITIPADRGSRLFITVNGTEYAYAAGATVTVPDEVAEAIANMVAEDPGGYRKSAKDEFLEGVAGETATLDAKIDGVAGDVEDLDTRLTALDDETDGAVPALDTRLTALDTPETGEIALLDARVTALEEGTGS